MGLLVYEIEARMTETMPAGTDNRTLIYPQDIFGRRTGIFNDRPSINWVGWNEFRAEVAGQRLQMGGSTTKLRHSDATGSTTMVTDQSGTVDWDVNFYPWGQSWQQSGNSYWDAGWRRPSGLRFGKRAAIRAGGPFEERMNRQGNRT